MSFGKFGLILIVEIALTACSHHSNDPRQNFAKSVVDSLVAADWDQSALVDFLCSDRPKVSIEKGIAFDLYRDYGGVKSVGTVKLISRATAPDMAMDTFVPVLFNARFVPYPTMPEHIAYRATVLQLQTQETADGKPCLEGWGRNEFPVDPGQTHDFLTYQGIYNHD